MTTPSTFSDLLEHRLRTEPGEPLITFYDHASGERVELSVATYANWVAKASGLLVDECDLERGDSLRIDLPTHWLGAVFLGAAWTVGLRVVTETEPDAVVCGPDTVQAWGERADDLVVLACSLLPLGVRFRDPLPAGVRDVGVEIWGQPDGFIPWDPPGSDDVALVTDGGEVTQTEMLAAAAAGSLLTDGGRLLTVANPTSPSGAATFTEPLVKGGSVVWVASPDADRLTATADQERATALLTDL